MEEPNRDGYALIKLLILLQGCVQLVAVRILVLGINKEILE